MPSIALERVCAGHFDGIRRCDKIFAAEGEKSTYGHATVGGQLLDRAVRAVPDFGRHSDRGRVVRERRRHDASCAQRVECECADCLSGKGADTPALEASPDPRAGFSGTTFRKSVAANAWQPTISPSTTMAVSNFRSAMFIAPRTDQWYWMNLRDTSSGVPTVQGTRNGICSAG